MPTSRKRLVLFVEGKSDGKAGVVLVKRLLAEHVDRPLDFLIPDPDPFRINGIHNLTGRAGEKWTRFLTQATRKRNNVCGVLVILDGDADFVLLENAKSGKLERNAFCPRDTAIHLAESAKSVGAGVRFSVACVFAIKEFESWFLAGVKSLSHARVSGLKAGISSPADIENIRDAKGWLSDNMPTKYKPTTHQFPMTAHVDLSEIRSHNLRSFRRLEKAIDELVTACKTGNHIVSPR